eukprot:CAMPEP_0195284972 /NCGR_PEP_ID=MMETSP0707-20130614/2974_1 /TAXON_ID=33640 /ORGANISM="Asterionellopsis glacialis, Strain CCMP134" /LENGTH=783 /DNA_ID=CAMNT_0040344391 /DNA_START=27 /DNA_END=2378 /DNA_ORIENTATION=+
MGEIEENEGNKKRKIEESIVDDSTSTGAVESKKKRNKDDVKSSKDTTTPADVSVTATTSRPCTPLVPAHVDATFDGKKWDWIDEFPKAEAGITTFMGPFLHGTNTETDLVGEVEAIAVWETMKTLMQMGYLCPQIAIPVTFSVDDHSDYYDEKDCLRLKSLPIGVAYIMLRDDPEKELAVHTPDGIYCGTISHFGVPPNHTWLRLRVNSKSELAQNFIPTLKSLPFQPNKFAFARFVHKRDDITNKDYITTQNPFVNEKDLRLYVETGLVKNALSTMFNIQKGEHVVASALVNYRNEDMSTSGPNILQIEVAQEWQTRDILTWLLVCIEDYYVHKFADCLRADPELLSMTTGNIDVNERDKHGNLEDGYLSKRGYGGHGTEMSKPLMFKMAKHNLKTSLDNITSRKLAPKPQRPLDPRLGFVSQRAQDLANNISMSIPDNVLPGMVVALTRAAMDPNIPDVNKPPALFTASRKSHNREVSKSIAEAVVCALPKERSQSSSDGSKDSKLGSTAVVDEVSDALVRKMVEAIPEKAALATAMVEASSDLDVQDDAMDKARAVVATAAEEGSISSTEKEDCAETKKEKSDLVEAVVRALPDAEVGNLAMGVDEKELTDVNIIKETQAGMGLSGALADAVTKVIPDRVLPEVAVAMTQAVIQEISDKDVMDSKYSVPTVTERGPGALANSVLNVVPDKMVPEVAVALTEAVMGAVPDGALGGRKLLNPVPGGLGASQYLADQVLKSVPDELMPEVAVALTKSVIGKIPDKDMSVSSSGSMKEDKLGGS